MQLWSRARHAFCRATSLLIAVFGGLDRHFLKLQPAGYGKRLIFLLSFFPLGGLTRGGVESLSCVPAHDAGNKSRKWLVLLSKT